MAHYQYDPYLALRAAVTADHHSRAAYTGKVRQRETVTIILEDGTCVEQDVEFTISWDTIVKLLSVIKLRAGIN